MFWQQQSKNANITVLKNKIINDKELTTKNVEPRRLVSSP